MSGSLLRFALAAAVGTGAAALLIYLAGRPLAGLEEGRLWILRLAASGLYIWTLIARPDAWLLTDLLVLAVAVLWGVLIGRAIASVPALIAFSLMVGLIDLISYYGGLSARIVEGWAEGRSDLLLYLTVAIPFNGRVLPVVGIGDLMILAGLFTALRLLGWPPLPSFLVPSCGLAIAFAVGFALGGVPALPFIGLAIAVLVPLRERWVGRASG